MTLRLGPAPRRIFTDLRNYLLKAYSNGCLWQLAHTRHQDTPRHLSLASAAVLPMGVTSSAPPAALPRHAGKGVWPTATHLLWLAPHRSRDLLGLEAARARPSWRPASTRRPLPCRLRRISSPWRRWHRAASGAAQPLPERAALKGSAQMLLFTSARPPAFFSVLRHAPLQPSSPKMGPQYFRCCYFTDQ